MTLRWVKHEQVGWVDLGSGLALLIYVVEEPPPDQADDANDAPDLVTTGARIKMVDAVGLSVFDVDAGQARSLYVGLATALQAAYGALTDA